MNDDDRRPLRRLALEMKARAGLLTDEEREELRSTPILIGGDEPGTKPLVVFPAMTQEEWEAEFGGLTRADAERQRREMFDGDPPPTLPTSDEGS